MIIVIFLLIVCAVFVLAINAARLEPPPKANLVKTSFLPIDLVVTWVNGADPQHQRLREKSLSLWESSQGVLHRSAKSIRRFTDRGELKFLFLSIDKYAPWIRQIHLVTADGQVPWWFNPSNERIRLVHHSEILSSEVLPTFNSHAIESSLHRIPNLSEYFLYANDDMFFGNATNPEYFLNQNGLMLFDVLPDTALNGNSRANESVTENDHQNAWSNNCKLLNTIQFSAVRRQSDHNISIISRTAMKAAEDHFGGYWKATSERKFRHQSDIVPVGLAQYLASYQGLGQWNNRNLIPMFSLGNSWSQNEFFLSLIQFVRPKLFCINDETDNPSRPVVEGLLYFLEHYFEVKMKPNWMK